jgi:UDP-N-acetylmuramyl tripeptide synthase
VVDNIKNDLRFKTAVTTSKFISFILKKVLGSPASALPGKVAMSIDPNFLQVLDERCHRKVIVTGTNGKTTTNNLLAHIIKGDFDHVLANLRGANMPQGLASAFLNDLQDEYDWGLFEVDEGSFQEVIEYIKPDYVIITNFFRDQLDRYGEIEKAFQDISDALEPLDTTLILNADDPLVSNFKKLGKKCVFYGVGENEFSGEQGGVVESLFCPECSSRLNYDFFNYGQLGKYSCPDCGFHNPEPEYEVTRIQYHNPGYEFYFKTKNSNMNTHFSYEGIYNSYNCCAALAVALEIGMDSDIVSERIKNFEYYLGRMETFKFPNKLVKVVLVKNPIGLGEVLNSLALDKRKKSILLVLNDNPADGTDISWIWDAEVENIQNVKNLNQVTCSGRRAEDMALRLKYAEYHLNNIRIDHNLDSALENILNEKVEIVYILPTYTAVFHIRELIMSRFGKKNKFMSNLREKLKYGN